MWQVLGENDAAVKDMLSDLGIYLKPSSFSKDVRPLLKEACSNIFGPACGVVDMLTRHIPSAKKASTDKVFPPSLPPLTIILLSTQQHQIHDGEMMVE